jgi:hypothetical protein
MRREDFQQKAGEASIRHRIDEDALDNACLAGLVSSI